MLQVVKKYQPEPLERMMEGWNPWTDYDKKEDPVPVTAKERTLKVMPKEMFINNRNFLDRRTEWQWMYWYEEMQKEKKKPGRLFDVVAVLLFFMFIVLLTFFAGIEV